MDGSTSPGWFARLFGTGFPSHVHFHVEGVRHRFPVQFDVIAEVAYRVKRKVLR